MRATPVEGQAPRQVVVIHSIITERILAEQRLKTKHNQITNILTSVQDAIWSFTLPDNEIIYASPSFEKMYDCPADEFQQSYYNKIITPDYLSAYEDALEQLLINDFVDVEYVITHLDGTKHQIHQHMYVTRDIQGTSSQRVDAISRDITKSKLIEKQTFQLQLQQERVQLLQNFVRDVSHDFRTPMSIINTNIYMLSRDTSTKSLPKRLEIMETQIQRLEKLLDQMILQSKLDAIDSEQYEFRSIDLKAMLHNIHLDFSKKAEQKGLQLKFTILNDSIVTYGNEDYLFQAIKSVLENSILYTSHGSINLTIDSIDDDIIIHIEDTGSGIATSDLPNIFERFFRVDKARSIETGGAGLGLSITKAIIDIHGGKINVASTLGSGTIVTIQLPNDNQLIRFSKALS